MRKKSLVLMGLIMGLVLISCANSNPQAINQNNNSLNYPKKSLLPATLPLVTQNSVFFPLNSFMIPNAYNQVINFNAQFLLENPSTKLKICGFKISGSSKDEDILVDKRIKQIRLQLLKLGVKSNQISLCELSISKSSPKFTVTKFQRVDLIYPTDSQAPAGYVAESQGPLIQIPR